MQYEILRPPSRARAHAASRSLLTPAPAPAARANTRPNHQCAHDHARAGMGGAYLTLLNTIANMGVILPKTPLFAAMDLLTVSSCRDSEGGRLAGFACPKKLRELAGSNACTDAGAAAASQPPRQATLAAAALQHALQHAHCQTSRLLHASVHVITSHTLSRLLRSCCARTWTSRLQLLAGLGRLLPRQLLHDSGGPGPGLRLHEPLPAPRPAAAGALARKALRRQRWSGGWCG